MKTKKENILVLVTAGKESKRFMELAKDAAEAGNGDLYILHVAQGENILESGEMYEMQRLADYGCRWADRSACAVSRTWQLTSAALPEKKILQACCWSRR